MNTFRCSQFLADLIDLDDLATPNTNSGGDDRAKYQGRRSSKAKIEAKPLRIMTSFDSRGLSNPAAAPESANGTVTPTEGMSARQLNVLKRKAKANKSATNKYNLPGYLD